MIDLVFFTVGFIGGFASAIWLAFAIQADMQHKVSQREES